jgi:hypothetical protein
MDGWLVIPKKDEDAHMGIWIDEDEYWVLK